MAVPISEHRREEPGSLMHTIRQHAAIPDAYSWATLGIKVPEAQKIVAQFDLMNERHAGLRAAYDQAAQRAAIHAETLLVVLDLVDNDPNDDTVRDAIRNVIRAGRDKVARLVSGDTRPSPAGEVPGG